MKLRPYQEDALAAILKSIGEGGNSLAVLPTGSGKTIIFSNVAKDMLPGRTLILAHREELIDQAIAKLHAATGIFADKEKAQHRASLNSDVVVASIQSMTAKRLKRWPSDHFACIICDEAHHSISKSWQSVLKHFNAPVLGVTATPDRGDKRNLGEFYDSITYEISLLELINLKYLAPIRVVTAPLEINLNDVKQTAGDFDRSGLATALDPYLPSIARELKRLAPHRKILVFNPLISSSKKFVEACNLAGIKSRHVDGTSKDRKEILEAFDRDEFQLISNAMLLPEGYDQPDVDCVVILRMTRSAALYKQMVGRGTRIDTFKDDLLLIDFLWLHEKHNLIRPAHLVAETPEQSDMITRVIEREAKAGGQGDLDLIGLTSDATREREEALAAQLRAVEGRKAEEKCMMDFCKTMHCEELADYQPAVKWDLGAISDDQAATLEANGIQTAGVRGRGHASALLDHLKTRATNKLATPKQMALIKRLGHPAGESVTFAEASAYIGRRIGNRRKK
jgi:superfamily II DNA or RNA helicase